MGRERVMRKKWGRGKDREEKKMGTAEEGGREIGTRMGKGSKRGRTKGKRVRRG